MKIQDLFFALIFLLTLWRQNSGLAIKLGIGSLILALPLFTWHVFFTAERLTWYGAAFFAYAVVLSIMRVKE